MKYLNPGYAVLFTSCGAVQGTDAAYKSKFDTGVYLNIKDKFIKQKVDAVQECWFSYDLYADTPGGGDYSLNLTLGSLKDANSAEVVSVRADDIIVRKGGGGVVTPYIMVGSTKVYKSESSFTITNTTNIELHFRIGDADGRVDMWVDNKLFMSYRHPTQFASLSMQYVYLAQTNSQYGLTCAYVSSFIYQDNRRIGMEKFKMLTIDPATEQSMPQGSTTNFKVSGLPEDTEYSDITGFGVVLQPTSRDANITQGTFSLNGATIGTVDVSSSSGGDFVQAYNTSNTMTGKVFTRDDIEGKTLSLTVNGAS